MIFQDSYGRIAYNWTNHWGHRIPTEQPLLQMGCTRRYPFYFIIKHFYRPLKGCQVNKNRGNRGEFLYAKSLYLNNFAFSPKRFVLKNHNVSWGNTVSQSNTPSIFFFPSPYSLWGFVQWWPKNVGLIDNYCVCLAFQWNKEPFMFFILWIFILMFIWHIKVCVNMN